MSLLRLVWITVWVASATLGYGETALAIALVGHAGIRAGAYVARSILRPGVVALLGVAAACYLMYASVHLCGWGCFWLLFFSFVSVKTTRYDSGHLKSIEFPVRMG